MNSFDVICAIRARAEVCRVKEVKRVFVVGNSCSGKTEIAKIIGPEFNLPVFHVDSIQFRADLSIRPIEETRTKVREMCSKPAWVFDGYGPLDLLKERMDKADLILFMDPPFWVLRLRFLKRALKTMLIARSELPLGAKELNMTHLRKGWSTQEKVHHGMRPELIKMFSSSGNHHKLVWIKI